MENGGAESVGGWVRFAAATVGALVRGAVAQCPEGAHTALWLEGLLLGKGDGLPVRVGAHERAILAQDFAIESARPVDTSQRVAGHDTREREVVSTSFLHACRGT